MSFDKLKEIASADSRGPSTQSNTPGRNVALKVTSFDLATNETVGINISTGIEERISLRPDKVQRKNERADVPAWSGKGKNGTRNKSYTEIGGTILFEAVYEYPTGLTARWGTSVSHTPTEAKVFVAPARPFVSKKESYGLEVIHTKRARMVNTVDELREALIAALPTQYSAVIVRFGRTNSDGSKEVITARDGKSIISRSINENNAYRIIEAVEAADRFMETDYGKFLASDIGTDFVTEVIPVERYFAGKDTRQMLGDKDKFQRYYKMEDGYVGFTPTIVTLRRHEEGGLYMSAEPIPTSTKPKIYVLDKVPTHILTPDPSVLEETEGSQTTDQAVPRSPSVQAIAEVRTQQPEAQQHTNFAETPRSFEEPSMQQPAQATPPAQPQPPRNGSVENSEPPARRGFGRRAVELEGGK
jgi:hypothetical protein